MHGAVAVYDEILAYIFLLPIKFSEFALSMHIFVLHCIDGYD